MKCIYYIRVRVLFRCAFFSSKYKGVCLQLACNFCFLIITFSHVGLNIFLIKLKIFIQVDALMTYMKNKVNAVSQDCMVFVL